MRKSIAILLAITGVAFAGSPEVDLKSTVLKHLTVSRDFTLKVAEAMPAADYGFKLTPSQMSFAGQMVHLSQGLTYFLSPFSGMKPDPPKPKSTDKSDVMAFVRSSFDEAIKTVSELAPDQLSKTFKGNDGPTTGADLLLGLLDHATHHRASAEMYLRAKGITPPEYEF